MIPDIEAALQVFDRAAVYVSNAGFTEEIEWQRSAQIDNFAESDFLREAAWVVLCSGFREKIVRRIFDHISLCFCEWESAAAILESDPACRLAAMASFRHDVKLRAIVKIADKVNSVGFAAFKRAVLADPLEELRRLQYIGPITALHLAKNLGLDIAKPDRHLVRISAKFGFESADHFCSELSRRTGEQRNVVDLIIWRYLADNKTKKIQEALGPNTKYSTHSRANMRPA
jgi:hypothetical protein